MENPEGKSEAHLYNFTHEKAGMQGIDREKIDQVIYEASKDSEFYKHQQERSKEIEEKVHSMKNEIIIAKTRGPSYIRSLTEEINKNLASIEAERIIAETWIHIDMDMFYASVEIRDDPSLADKPIAVGDNSMIATANYIARQYGVRSAMPGFIGKKLCKDLIFVKPSFGKYKEDGEKVREIFREFDPDFESMGLDEGNLRVTEVLINNGMNDDEGRNKLASLIRQKIFEKTKLNASAGIACNKVLAKIATDLGKPNGQYYVPFEREAILAFMADLNIRKIPGIGKVLEKILNELGVFKCHQILQNRLDLYIAFKGGNFNYLARAALGIGPIFHPETREDQKSISVSTSFKATDDWTRLSKILEEFSNDISTQLSEKEASAKCISVTIKNFRFVSNVKSETLNRYISKEPEIFEVALRLLKELGLNEKIRMIGVRVSSLIYNRPGAIDEMIEKMKIEPKKSPASIKVFEQNCPVCNKTFLYTEKRMQLHVDQCLESTPKVSQRVQKKPKPVAQKLTLDNFYGKKK